VTEHPIDLTFVGTLGSRKDTVSFISRNIPTAQPDISFCLQIYFLATVIKRK
jgi:hypothetical protein